MAKLAAMRPGTGEGRQRIALAIAGFDPSSGAGITADLQVFAAHNVFGTCAITALTVQSTVGVEAVEPVRPALLTQTLDCLWRDLPPQGIKLGMLGSAATVLAVADFFDRLLGPAAAGHSLPIVLDPVLRSSSGATLTEDGREALQALHERLLPRVGWITPNWVELAVLAGQPVASEQDAVQAAEALAAKHPHLNIVATGGDQPVPTDLVRSADGRMHRLTGEHIESRSTHGTGCAFSSALLCRLMAGDSSYEAVSAAKRYVAEAIRRAPGLGHGRGPLELLWPLRQPEGGADSGTC